MVMKNVKLLQNMQETENNLNILAYRYSFEIILQSHLHILSTQVFSSNHMVSNFEEKIPYVKIVVLSIDGQETVTEQIPNKRRN